MTAKKRIVTVIVTIVIVCALGTGGFFLYKKFSGGTSKKGEKVYVQKVSAVNTAGGADLFSNTFAGVIVAQKSVDVKYDSSKTIDEILVSEGDTVKKGDKLFTYDVEAIQLEIDTAKLEVERMENSIKTNKEEIAQLEKEKQNASQDAAVSYTTQILSLESDNARSEYDIKAKNVEIQKLEASTKNAFVTAAIDGTIKNLKEPTASSNEYDYDYSENADVLMQISADGDYRVKGIFNEQNGSEIAEGVPVILKSRVDDTEWAGTISEIDASPQKSDNNMYYSGESDETTSSSKYAFYVSPESLDGFMLGQHIIIEIDNGQSAEIVKTGIWLYTDFICKDGDKSFVWAKNDKDKIEKRYVEIGEKDEEFGDCEIKSGLEAGDYIAYPEDYIEEGMETTTNQSDISVPDNDLGGDEFAGEGEFNGEDEFTDGYMAGDGEELSFEEMYGITEEEFAAMSEEEQEEFFNSFMSEDGETAGDGEATDSGEADGSEEKSFEELYGITEEEFDAMSEEEQENFLNSFYEQNDQ